MTRAALDQAGVRLLPYPFGSSIAVVSDIDSSSRQKYRAYVGEMVEQLGLDFGDSTWLRWQSQKHGNSAFGTAAGFFSRHYALGRRELPAVYDNTRTLNESVAEFHLGNVDHYHAFSSRGPRVVVIDSFTVRDDGAVEIVLEQFQEAGPWHCRDFFIFGVCVVDRPGLAVSPASVTITDRDGTIFDGYRAASHGDLAAPRGRTLFILNAPPQEEVAAPELQRVSTIVIRFGDPAAARNVEKILLVNVVSEILLDRLGYLREHYNVEIPFITEHAGYHFRASARAKKVDGDLQAHTALQHNMAHAYNGSLLNPDGTRLFSIDPDEADSFGRVFPELTRDLEVRFVVPMAAGSPFGWDPLQLVTPSTTRMGCGIYWARRMLPNIQTPQPGQKFDRTRTKHDTFVPRIARILDYAAGETGLFYPLYTHLGGGVPARGEDDDDDDVSARSLPVPYFERETMLALQDRVFNISGSVKEEARLWFNRATVHYDYALMLESICDHVRRPDADTIGIESWDDAVLGKRMPRTRGQLYGLTFYVDDASRARVLLDGTELQILARNPPDATGRPSVTICESELRFDVFDRLDPRHDPLRSPAVENGSWTWQPRDGNDPDFGRLTVSGGSRRAIASAEIPMAGWTPTGAQGLAFSVRTFDKASFGVIVETVTGGKFFFGDRSALARLDEPETASYRFRRSERAEGAWLRLFAPFWDLVWDEAAAPGGPFPSHGIERIRVLCFGQQGVRADFARMSFVRPRTNSTVESGRYCLTGRIQPFAPGQVVTCADPQGGFSQTQEVDPRGFFCFERLTPGIYRVASATSDGELVDRRGALVEVTCNIANLDLCVPG